MALARALLAADRAAEAAAILDDLPELGGQPAIQRLTAEAKAKSGHYREAEELYEALWEADPGDREIAAALIDLYEDEDKLDEALAVLAKLAAKRRRQPGRRRADRPRPGARRTASPSRSRRPASSSRSGPRTARRSGCSRPCSSSGAASAEGEKILRGLLEADPDDPVTRRALASELVRERRFDEARAMYEDLGRRAGDDPRKAESEDRGARSSSDSSRTSRGTTRARGRILTPVAHLRTARFRTGPPGSCSPSTATARTSPTAARAPRPTRPRSRATRSGRPQKAEFRYRLGEKKAAEATLDALGASGQLEKMMAAADAYGRLKHYDAAVRIAREAVGASSRSPPTRSFAWARASSAAGRPGRGGEGLPAAAGAAARTTRRR